MHLNKNMKLAIVAACVVAAFTYGLRLISPNRDGRKLLEVQTVAFGLPVFSGLKEVEHTVSSGYTSVLVSRRFKCLSGCEGVVEYYSKYLTANGWSQTTPNDHARDETLFRKGDLTISVFWTLYGTTYDYAIDTSWFCRLKRPPA